MRSTGTVFYSLLYLNSRRSFNGLKYMYSIISVIVDSLQGNTKNRESTRSCTARVRLVHSWAVKVGLGISRANADSQWNPVYNAFHLFFVVETKRFVGSFVNVILTRQTCGQRSSRVVESKRRALGNCFSERICYMFLISKCRVD